MLLERIKYQQQLEGLNDYKFSDKIGISHQLWQMIKVGKRPIGLTIIRAILKTYPHLAGDVFYFLTGSSLPSGTIYRMPQSASESNRGVLRGMLVAFLKRLRLKRSD